MSHRNKHATTMCYLHVQDFVNGYIGPFATEAAAHEHYRWTKEVRGDGAAFMGILSELPDMDDPENCGIVCTPEQDKAWVDNHVVIVCID